MRTTFAALLVVALLAGCAGEPGPTDGANPGAPAPSSTAPPPQASPTAPSHQVSGGVDAPNPFGGGGSSSANHTVELRGLAFAPETTNVTLGQSVEFVNRDAELHTATSSSFEGFDTGDLETDETVRVTPEGPGTYEVVCAYHAEMRATLVVSEA